ncbi:MAG: hypothetical protein DRP96_00320 [Candidatus Neomarinimicrobiota bacterium]|nr:MAG: hypothetical protein DRP96_00320 [Candidatus Neomarinimicrobiota bacterium]
MGIKQIYKKERLDPGILSILINPYYFIKKNLIAGLRRNSDYVHGIALDFGCGNRGYKDLFATKVNVGLDIKKSGHNHSSENIDIYYDGKRIPFRNESFDSIISIEVFEHVFNLEHILDELNRVLKPGGNILISTPFIWEEHEQPFDFARYTGFGMQHLLETHGFSVINIQKSCGFIETIFQIWNSYVYKKLFCRSKLLQLISIPLLVFPSNLIGTLLAFILPKSKDLYLNLIVVAKKNSSIPSRR